MSPPQSPQHRDRDRKTQPSTSPTVAPFRRDDPGELLCARRPLSLQLTWREESGQVPGSASPPRRDLSCLGVARLFLSLSCGDKLGRPPERPRVPARRAPELQTPPPLMGPEQPPSRRQLSPIVAPCGGTISHAPCPRCLLPGGSHWGRLFYMESGRQGLLLGSCQILVSHGVCVHLVQLSWAGLKTSCWQVESVLLSGLS